MKRFVGLIALVAGLAGCAPQLVSPEVDQQIGRALGGAQAIEYLEVGEPIDVEETLPGNLPLHEAISQALRHDPELQAALARVQIALADARQSRLLPNPVLSVVARFPESGGSPTIEAGLSAELLSLLRRPRQISAADNRLRAASAEALTVALDLVNRVQDVYVGIQAADAELAGLQRRRELIDRLLSGARSRVEVGESSRLDVLTLDAQRVHVEADRIRAQSEGREHRLTLARLIGRPSDAAQWTVASWVSPADVTIDEKGSIAKALEHRPEVQAARWELAALDDDAANAGMLIDGGEIGIEAEREGGNWSVGPGISTPLPFLDWGQARRQRAQAEVVAARHRLVGAQRQVIEDVRRALAAMQAARQSLEIVDRDLIPSVQRRQEQASSAYSAGEANITTVLLAEQDLQEAYSERIESQRRFSEAYGRFQRAVGGPGVVSGK